MKKIYLSQCFFIVTLFLLVTNMLSAQVQRKQVYMNYITQHTEEAQRQMARYGIPASITMAQALVETGAGTSSLAREHNNHFGIKCHRSWNGGRAFKTDDMENECFRSYKHWKDSYEDHSKFLLVKRYERLFRLRADDYKGWAKGLQECGYATNKGYANMLIKIVEDYELYALDKGVKASWQGGRGEYREAQAEKTPSTFKGPKREAYLSYGLLYVIAVDQDSYDRIAQDMGIPAKKIARYNDTPLEFTLRKGDIVYLEPKRSKATAPYFDYVVRVGDSMHSIAQRYGIRMENLYKLNNKDGDYIPEEGDVLRLR